MPFARYYNPLCSVTIVGNVIAFAAGRGLNMRITIERSMEPTPDRADIAIEGIDPVRARLMGRVYRETALGQLVQISLGYDTTPMAAFTGRLESFVDTVPRGQSTWTFATAGDGADAWDVDKLVPAGAAVLTAADQVRGAIAVLGLVAGPSVEPILAGSADAIKPFSASGVRTAADLLDDACRTLRARWWIRDGMLHLVRLGLPTPGPALILAPYQPGPRLPGIPVIEPASYGGAGLLQVTTFLDPGLVPGGQVVYEGGAFRVESVVHSLETRGAAPWTSRITGRAL